MKFRVSKRILSLFLILVMISSYGMVASGVTDEVQAEKEKSSNIQKLIDETEKQLTQIKNDKTDIESYIKAIDQQMQGISNSIEDLNNQIDKKNTEINNNQAILEQTKLDLQEQYESMKLRIQYMYEHQTENYIAILFQSSDMADMLNKAEYINKITDYDRQALMKYAETEKKIQDTQIALEDEQKKLEESLATVEAQKQSMKLVQDSKNTQLKLLESKANSANSAITTLSAQKKEQDAIIAKMEQEQIEKEKNGSQGPSYSSGKFAWPVPASHRITSIWGEMEDRIVAHAGVDIGASTPGVSGDKIVASEAGEVTKAEYNSSAGNWVWIYHGKGVYTVYMHASKLLVKEGDIVSKEQVIALMGNTGNSFGAHLHFGVRVNGAYVNPESYIKYMQYYKK